jgi:hypothetical protein
MNQPDPLLITVLGFVALVIFACILLLAALFANSRAESRKEKSEVDQLWHDVQNITHEDLKRLLQQFAKKDQTRAFVIIGNPETDKNIRIRLCLYYNVYDIPVQLIA